MVYVQMRYLGQGLVWVAGEPDIYGQPTFNAPRPMKHRWEDRTGLFINNQGRQEGFKHRVYMDTPVKPGDRQMIVPPPSKDIIELLLSENIIEKGFVGSDAINVPETFVTALDIGGDSNPRWLRDNNRVHIRVKAQAFNYMEGWETAQRIKDFLLGKRTIMIGDVYYIRFVINSDIYLVSYDQNNRPIFAMEFTVTREYEVDSEYVGNRDQLC
jgi:hypothetical protein